MRRSYWLILLLPLSPGCKWLVSEAPAPVSPCSHYHAAGFAAALGPRVLLLPLANETCFPQAADQVQDALAAELQRMGHLEVVVPPCGAEAGVAQMVHVHGRFDEASMLTLARTLGVQTILLGTLTDYRPYTPQRIGLSLRLISPPAAAVIASVDGLWDARDKGIEGQLGPSCFNAGKGLGTPFNNELDAASPQRFQQFVCRQAVSALLNPTPAPAAEAPSTTGPRPALPAPQAGSVNATDVVSSAKAQQSK